MRCTICCFNATLISNLLIHDDNKTTQVIENLAYQVNVSADAGNGAPTNEQITGYMIDMIEAVADKAGFT